LAKRYKRAGRHVERYGEELIWYKIGSNKIRGVSYICASRSAQELDDETSYKVVRDHKEAGKQAQAAAIGSAGTHRAANPRHLEVLEI
jgi:hypothetical protein